MTFQRFMVTFLLACWLSMPTEAQVPFPGGCPSMSVVTDFQVARYLGKWYEAEKYFALFELGGKCIDAEYTDNGDGVVGVKNTQMNLLLPSEIEGNATLVGNDGKAKLSVKFPNLPPAPYWVVATDYDNYALVWSCDNDSGLSHTINSWILTRERNPPRSVLNKAHAAAKKNNVILQLFMPTDQQNCTN